MAAPNQTIRDTFTGSNGPLSASWTGGLYSTSSAAEIVGNAFGGPSGGGFFDAYWDVATYGTAAAEAYATVSTKSGNGELMYLVVQAQSPGTTGYDAYMLTLTPSAGTDTIGIVRTINEVDTSLGTRSQEVAAGDGLALVTIIGVSDVTLQVWHRVSGTWSQLGADIVDTSGSRITAAGYIGAGVEGITGRWDDFGGGEHAASAVVTPEPSSAAAKTAGPVATGGEPPPDAAWADYPIAFQRLTRTAFYFETDPLGVIAAQAFFDAATGVTVAPSASSSVTATADPTVVLGSLSIAPATSSAIAATVDPTVGAGGNVTITPDAAVAVAATANPTTVLGSVSVSPAASTAVAATVNPTVTLGGVTVAPAASTAAAATPAPTTLLNALVGLRFYGSDPVTYNDVDRMRIPLRNAGSPTAADVGAGDFTYEVWVRCAYADNTSTRTDDWRYSNIIFDRDAWNSPRGHGLGVARDGSNLVPVFGVAGPSLTHATIAGTTNIGDGAWHHIAVRRTQSSGLIQLLTDGVVEDSGTYVTTTLAYDGSNAGGQDNDAIIIGREKHDVGVGFNGTIDAIRVSSARRTLAPERPLLDDSDTAVLYWLNEATGTSAADASGNGVTATIQRGGPSNGPAWVVEAGVGTQVSPSASVSVAATVNPTVSIGGLQIAPSASSAVATTANPTTVLGSVAVTPGASSAVGATQGPTVVLGALSVAPSASAAVAATVNPTVSAGGSITIAPSASTAVAATTNPIVVLGAVTVAPAASSAAAATANPVTVFGPISLTPSSAAARAASADPTVALGSLVIGPGVSAARLATVDPTVAGVALATVRRITVPGVTRQAAVPARSVARAGASRTVIVPEEG